MLMEIWQLKSFNLKDVEEHKPFSAWLDNQIKISDKPCQDI